MWDDIPLEVRRVVLADNEAHTVIARASRAVASEVDYVLAGIGINPIYLKGAVSGVRYYESSDERPFRDLDVLVTSEKAALAYDALRRMDFVQGEYDPSLRDVSESNLPIVPDAGGEYELPRLSKMVDVIAPQSSLQLLSSYEQRGLDATRSGGLRVPVSVEIHYRLEPHGRLPRDSVRAPYDWIPNGWMLTLEADLIYLCYKAYVDIRIFHDKGSSKLVADIVRLLARHSREMDWTFVWRAAHEGGVCRPVGYFLHHAHYVYGISESAPPACTGNHTQQTDADLDLGDPLPALLDNEGSFTFEV